MASLSTPMGSTFIEQWIAGTYLVCGIFPSEVQGLTVSDAAERIPALYATTKSQKRRYWPRGVCGYYLIPIYISSSFDATVVEWAREFHRYRWAIWHEPILYSTAHNTVDMRADYGLYASAYRPFLFRIVHTALAAVTSRFHPGTNATINPNYDAMAKA